MFHTGFHKTPVASMATWVTPCAVSQSASSSRALVMVPNSRTSSCGFCPGDAQRMAAKIFRRCRYRPATLQKMWSMAVSLKQDSLLGDTEDGNILLRVLPIEWGQQFRVRSGVQARLLGGLARRH